MTEASSRMTSHRPYLLRALNEWIADNGMTPHLLVDATQAGVQVPASAVKEGKVVLNIAERAVVRLMIDNDAVSFTARFGGVSHAVHVPVSAVLAIYSRETGQGMALPDDVPHDTDAGGDDGEAASSQDTPPDDDAPPPAGKRPPFLRVVK
ncbi:ClpXP protease specificity-enhancing factor [Pseudoxanthomonas sp.]|jgi:Stringent starvation protein B|uniref:ClpXP protease specificity-enhancing factor n=1 Tax=Pseudoxanthomonas sp. TaxID=1871049 RepID=UPI002FE3902E